MKASRFVAKEDNLGGRNAIRRQLLEHHNAVVCAKPTIDSRTKPRPHVDSKVSHEHKVNRREGAFAYNEVYQSFKKVTNVKEAKGGYIDNKKPDTYDIAKKALPKNKKKMDFINQEHLLNLKSQARRIGNIGKTMTERKKNEFDPIAHPSVFFRREDQSKKDLTLDYMFSTNVGAGRKTTAGFNLTKMKSKVTKRPLSAYKSNELDFDMFSPEEPILADELLNDKNEVIPEFSGSEKDDEAYKEFKLKVIDHIIDKRIYKVVELELLREKIKLKYPKLDKKKIDDMFEQINMDLDK